MQYTFGKERLRPGESYPLKRTNLDEMLTSIPEELVTEVSYRRAPARLSQGIDIGPHLATLKAHYVGIEDRWPYKDRQHGEVIITVGVVRSDERSEAATLLQTALTRLADWLATIPSRPPTWRSEPHQFELYFAEGAVGEREDGVIRYPTSYPPL